MVRSRRRRAGRRTRARTRAIHTALAAEKHAEMRLKRRNAPVIAFSRQVKAAADGLLHGTLLSRLYSWLPLAPGFAFHVGSRRDSVLPLVGLAQIWDPPWIDYITEMRYGCTYMIDAALRSVVISQDQELASHSHVIASA